MAAEYLMVHHFLIVHQDPQAKIRTQAVSSLVKRWRVGWVAKIPLLCAPRLLKWTPESIAFGLRALFLDLMANSSRCVTRSSIQNLTFSLLTSRHYSLHILQVRKFDFPREMVAKSGSKDPFVPFSD